MNQDPLLYKILFLIASILLGIIGFFATLFISRLLKSTDELSDSVNKLGGTITGMNAIILSNDEKFRTRKVEVDKRLNKHSELLDEHNKDIAVLKERVK